MALLMAEKTVAEKAVSMVAKWGHSMVVQKVETRAETMVETMVASRVASMAAY